jgi:hypothetical protein
MAHTITFDNLGLSFLHLTFELLLPHQKNNFENIPVLLLSKDRLLDL